MYKVGIIIGEEGQEHDSDKWFLQITALASVFTTCSATVPSYVVTVLLFISVNSLWKSVVTSYITTSYPSLFRNGFCPTQKQLPLRSSWQVFLCE